MGILRRHSYISYSIILLTYIVVQTRSSYMTSYVTLILMAVTLLVYRAQANSVYARWVFVMVIYWLIGMINQNQFEHMLSDMVAFFPFVLLLADNSQFRKDFLSNQLAGFRRLLPVYLILYVMILNYMEFNVLGSDESRFDYNEDTHLVLMAPIAPLVIVRYLLCYDGKYSTKMETLCTIVAVLMFLHFALITATKSVVTPILLVVAMRLLLNRNEKNRLKYLGILLVVAYLSIDIAEVLVSGTLSRFYDKFDLDNASNVSRWEETTLYLSNCNAFELFFGKGFGGIKTFHGEEFIGGISMLHLGFGHLIMKGGLFLLILMYYPLLYIMVKDFLTRHYEYVIIAACLLMQDIGHEIWQSFIQISAYWLLVYYRFYNRGAHHRTLALEQDGVNHDAEHKRR